MAFTWRISGKWYVRRGRARRAELRGRERRAAGRARRSWRELPHPSFLSNTLVIYARCRRLAPSPPTRADTCICSRGPPFFIGQHALPFRPTPCQSGPTDSLPKLWECELWRHFGRAVFIPCPSFLGLIKRSAMQIKQWLLAPCASAGSTCGHVCSIIASHLNVLQLSCSMTYNQQTLSSSHLTQEMTPSFNSWEVSHVSSWPIQSVCDLRFVGFTIHRMNAATTSDCRKTAELRKTYNVQKLDELCWTFLHAISVNLVWKNSQHIQHVFEIWYLTFQNKITRFHLVKLSTKSKAFCDSETDCTNFHNGLTWRVSKVKRYTQCVRITNFEKNKQTNS